MFQSRHDDFRWEGVVKEQPKSRHDDFRWQGVVKEPPKSNNSTV